MAPVDGELQFAALSSLGILLAKTRDIGIIPPSLVVGLGIEASSGVFGLEEVDVPVDGAGIVVLLAEVGLNKRRAATKHVHSCGLARPVEV